MARVRRASTPELRRDAVALVGRESKTVSEVARATGVKFYFATPHHAWERGANENPNGLIRQYLPKRTSMAHTTQHDCNRIARKLNPRPRKRYDYQAPDERFQAAKRLLRFECEAKRHAQVAGSSYVGSSGS